ncbi:MAG: hypothetical protein Q8N82_02935 [Deltaproteobacteria bacterium]|nr:hypothetical protein [Deltaproteobacteria bacterium]
MVQVDLPGAFAAGQIFAFLSRGYLKKEKHLFMHRLMGPMAVYFALLFAPAGLFLLICWPAWECMYRWEWVEKPAGNPSVSFFYVGFYMAMVVIGCASYMLAHRLYRQGKDRTVKRLCAAGVIVTLLPFFLRPFTWYYVGTYAQYHALPRQTATFGTPSFFFSWLGAMGYFIIASVFFGLWLKKKSKIIEV